MPCVAEFFQVWGAMIQTIALVITLTVIILYTIFTYQLRKATVRQTELQLTPYIILDYKNDLICRNIGNSPAINVEISTYEAFDKDSGKLVFKVNFPSLYILEPKEEKTIKPETKFEDKDLEYLVKAIEDMGKKKIFSILPKGIKG